MLSVDKRTDAVGVLDRKEIHERLIDDAGRELAAYAHRGHPTRSIERRNWRVWIALGFPLRDRALAQVPDGSRSQNSLTTGKECGASGFCHGAVDRKRQVVDIARIDAALGANSKNGPSAIHDGNNSIVTRSGRRGTIQNRLDFSNRQLAARKHLSRFERLHDKRRPHCRTSTLSVCFPEEPDQGHRLFPPGVQSDFSHCGVSTDCIA